MRVSLAMTMPPVDLSLVRSYQPEDGHGPTISEQLQLDPFGRVVAAADSMLVLHTTLQEVYDRKWCWYVPYPCALLGPGNDWCDLQL